MSLLDCICCCKHRLRTGACWDNPDEFSPRLFTYSCLIEQSLEICSILRSSCRTTRTVQPYSSSSSSSEPQLMLSHGSCSRSRAPVGIYGRNCSEVLCAVLGTMAVPSPYMPLDLCHPPRRRWKALFMCGVHTVLIELSLFDVSSSQFCSALDLTSYLGQS